MRRWAPAIWYGLIFVTSCSVISQRAFVSSVSSGLPTQAAKSGFGELWRQDWWVFVKGWHATEFAILFLLVRRAAPGEGRALAIVAVAAALDEFHQTFVPGRGGRLTDVLIDVAGALVAAIIVRWRSAPRPSPTALSFRP